MLTCRIAVAAAAALATLVTPALAHADHGAAHPSATPLLVELAAVGLFGLVLLARGHIARVARTSWSRVTSSRRRAAPAWVEDVAADPA